MNALHEKERDIDYREQRAEYRDQRGDDREISLGIGTILGIFFALALLCAVFFGFGYATGRKSYQPVSSITTETAPTSGILGGLKPSATGALSLFATKPGAKSAPAESSATLPLPDDPSANTSDPGPSRAVHLPVIGGDKPRTADPEEPETTASSRASAKPSIPATATPAGAGGAIPAVTPDGKSLVQVAAVSHAEDADVLLSALKKRGYAVFIRQEPQDHLLHVQIGPFATRKDADTMRQRLLSDGYNAIVK